MANIKSVKKDIRKSRKHRTLNVQQLTRLRNLDKKIKNFLYEGNFAEAESSYQIYISYLDRAGKKNLVHHRHAARKKSRIARMIKLYRSEMKDSA